MLVSWQYNFVETPTGWHVYLWERRTENGISRRRQKGSVWVPRVSADARSSEALVALARVLETPISERPLSSPR